MVRIENDHQLEEVDLLELSHLALVPAILYHITTSQLTLAANCRYLSFNRDFSGDAEQSNLCQPKERYL